MEYIISKGRNEHIPRDKFEMEKKHWFNMWPKQFYPYRNLKKGDILYWLDGGKNRFVWKTEVVEVKRKRYSDKNEIKKKYGSMTQKYFEDRTDSGYFLYYNIKVIDKFDRPKPNQKLDRIGWVELTDDNYLKWFVTAANEDKPIIADAISTNDIIKKLQELNDEMQDVSPKRAEMLISVLLRNDAGLIKLLKEVAGYKCQFPDCGMQIKKEKGGFYIEVAHIDPVKRGGQSILGNLLVLCPNHHKEFDYGALEINYQTLTELSGTLNGKDFKIAPIALDRP